MTTAAVVSVAHAGSMGPVSMASSYTPYLTGEASYTWPQLGNLMINKDLTTTTSQGWGGRLGAGMMYNYNEKLSFTGELGGGYYGSKNRKVMTTTGAVASNGSMAIDGYDLLAGFVYKWTYFDVFFQGGFMLENARVTQSVDLGLASPGNFYHGYVSQNGNSTQALPEIKVGGIYNINPNWGLDVAYMHVFGSTPSFNGSFAGTTTGGVYKVIDSVSQNPTLDSVMFGVHYNFVM